MPEKDFDKTRALWENDGIHLSQFGGNPMKPCVTVLIPVYNRRAYLEECIRSVQNQTWQELEILLVDDGSTDGTLECCRALAREDSRIRVLTQNHGGVSAARNLGLAQARGEYIFFLDSDDVIRHPLIEALTTAMEAHHAPMGGTQCQSILEEYWHKVQARLREDAGPGETVFLEHEALLHAAFTGSSPMGMIGGVMIRRDWIGETRFRTDLYIGEDFYFVYENMIKGASGVFLKQKWYYARNHATNSSWDWELSGFLNRFYRRRLVWEKELSLGRPAYADIQKQQAFGIFTNFLRKNLPKEDQKRMRGVMKEYRAQLFGALSLKRKLAFILYVDFPWLTPVCLRIADWRKDRKNT